VNLLKIIEKGEKKQDIAKDSGITASTLSTIIKYTEGNEGMDELFKPLGVLENRIENNVLNKQKQLTLHQFFKNDNIIYIYK
jgi:hypothetical protein